MSRADSSPPKKDRDRERDRDRDRDRQIKSSAKDVAELTDFVCLLHLAVREGERKREREEGRELTDSEWMEWLMCLYNSN